MPSPTAGLLADAPSVRCNLSLPHPCSWALRRRCRHWGEELSPSFMLSDWVKGYFHPQLPLQYALRKMLQFIFALVLHRESRTAHNPRAAFLWRCSRNGNDLSITASRRFECWFQGEARRGWNEHNCSIKSALHTRKLWCKSLFWGTLFIAVTYRLCSAGTLISRKSLCSDRLKTCQAFYPQQGCAFSGLFINSHTTCTH